MTLFVYRVGRFLLIGILIFGKVMGLRAVIFWVLSCIYFLNGAVGDERAYFFTELDAKPAILSEPDLFYPDDLKEKGETGNVRMVVLIDQNGKTEVSRVVESSHSLFEASARMYASGLVYEVPMKNGKPVKARTLVSVDFKLDGLRFASEIPNNKDNSDSLATIREELQGMSREELAERLKEIVKNIGGPSQDQASRQQASADSFNLNQLDSVPKRVSGDAPEYPFDLRNQGVEGLVKLLVMIQKDGSVWVERVTEASNLAFIIPAIRCAESCRFEVPKKNGRPVNARFIFPLSFKIQ
ncbi:MAG: energy transducer TonB [Verrucomicrobiota bacterium]